MWIWVRWVDGLVDDRRGFVLFFEISGSNHAIAITTNGIETLYLLRS